MPKAGSDPGTMRVTSLTHAIFLIGGQQNGAREKRLNFGLSDSDSAYYKCNKQM